MISQENPPIFSGKQHSNPTRLKKSQKNKLINSSEPTEIERERVQEEDYHRLFREKKTLGVTVDSHSEENELVALVTWLFQPLKRLNS